MVYGLLWSEPHNLLPAQLQVSSWVNYYWSSWLQVITFGLALGKLDKILPISSSTLWSLTGVPHGGRGSKFHQERVVCN